MLARVSALYIRYSSPAYTYPFLAVMLLAVAVSIAIGNATGFTSGGAVGK